MVLIRVEKHLAVGSGSLKEAKLVKLGAAPEGGLIIKQLVSLF